MTSRQPNSCPEIRPAVADVSNVCQGRLSKSIGSLLLPFGSLVAARHHGQHGEHHPQRAASYHLRPGEDHVQQSAAGAARARAVHVPYSIPERWAMGVGGLRVELFLSWQALSFLFVRHWGGT